MPEIPPGTISLPPSMQSQLENANAANQTNNAPEAKQSEQKKSPEKSPSKKVYDPPTLAAVRDEIVAAIRTHDVFVLEAGTGSGKSVLAPLLALQAVQEENPGKKVRVLVAEPRQMLAETVSTDAAEINNVTVGGDLIGYYHGNGHKYSPDTQVVYTVNGSLRKRMEENITLKAFDAVFLDEIHLRDTNQEAILLSLKLTQKERVKHGLKPLKIVITSATADEKYAQYFENAIRKQVEGREPRHTVNEYFADTTPQKNQIPLEMARLAAKLIKDKRNHGDVLGFLPGRYEIQVAQKEFDRIMQQEGLANKYKAASLTGGGGAENKLLQKKLKDEDPNRDPIVAFATDVAEAGATFPRLTKVIDSGLVRDNIYDSDSGLESLQTTNHAKSHYIQRKGRLGRTGNGEFHALYTEADLTDLSKHPKDAVASILKENLAPLILSLKTMGINDVYAIDYIDHPGKAKIDNAIKTLSLFGALKPDGSLTDVGREMAQLPYDLHLARMMVEAKKQGCVEAASVIAGFINSGKSVFAFNPKTENFEKKYGRYFHEGSDFLTLLNIWNEYIKIPSEKKWQWAMDNGFSPSVLSDAKTTAAELLQEDIFAGLHTKPLNAAIGVVGQSEAIRLSVTAGFIDRLLQHKGGTTYALLGGKPVSLNQSSVLINAGAPLIISGNIHTVEKTGRAFAGLNQVVSEQLIKEIAPHIQLLIEKEKAAEKETLPQEVKKEEQKPPAKPTEVTHSTLASHISTATEAEKKKKKISWIQKIKTFFRDWWKEITDFFSGRKGHKKPATGKHH